MAFSSVVVAGNKYIYDYVIRSGITRVEILPTVVNIQNYAIKQDINHFPFRVGWIGSPSTSRHINIASEALNKFCKIKYAEFVAIGALEQDLTKIPGQLIQIDRIHVAWRDAFRLFPAEFLATRSNQVVYRPRQSR